MESIWLVSEKIVKSKNFGFFMRLGLFFGVFFVIPHVFAATTNDSDLKAVTDHIKSEVKGNVLQIILYVGAAISAIGMIVKFNYFTLIGFLGLLTFAIYAPGIIDHSFGALI